MATTVATVVDKSHKLVPDFDHGARCINCDNHLPERLAEKCWAA